MKFLNTLKQPYFNELDSTGGIDETEEVEGLEETEELEQIETPEEPTEEGQPEPRKFKVKFNKEEKEIEEEEAIPLIQKGMNYDHVKTELDTIREEFGTTKSQMDKIQKALQAYGYEGTPDEIADVIMAQMQEMSVDDYKAQQEAEQRRLQELKEADPEYQNLIEFRRREETRLIMAQDLAAIKKEFPQEVANSLDEIKNSQEYMQYIRKGYDAIDAYKLANPDLLAKKAKKPTGEDKSHLITVGGTKGSNVEVPTEVMAEYKKLMPKLTNEEIYKHYNQNK